MIWTDGHIEAARLVLERSETIGRATSYLTGHFGCNVTADALQKAFRRRGLGAPTSFLRHPPVRPVPAEPAESAMRPRPSGGLERLLIVPDCHHPYVDEDAWEVMLASGREFKPHRIITLGDFGDFYCLSRHRKNPNRETQLEAEVIAGNKALDQLESLGATHMHFVQGNHEESLERYLADNAPAMFNMITTRGLYRLEERGWTYTPYRDHLHIGKVHYTHDVGACGGKAHESAEADYQSNVVIGHTHRAAVSYSGSVLGDRHVGIMSGWLGDVKMAEYLHNAKKTRHWQHAFTLGWMEPSGVTHFQLVPIVNGSACVNGEIVRAAA